MGALRGGKKETRRVVTEVVMISDAEQRGVRSKGKSDCGRKGSEGFSFPFFGQRANLQSS